MNTPASPPGAPDTAVLVPAAGRGERLGVGVPKALAELGGEPLLVHAVRRLAQSRSVALIVVAAPPLAVDDVHDLLRSAVGEVPLTVVAGGSSRQESVAAALAAVPADVPIVLVHDAARPLTPPALVDEVAAAVRAGHEAVIPALPVVDTIKRVDDTGTVVDTVDRSVLRAVQTPQGFARDTLVAAHKAAGDDVTDDATLAERIGVAVHTVPGRPEALKVTRPLDLVLAEALLASAPGDAQ
jgi:2-C-methyl-D-erythritol 4-phosphate cytidylyltransferase